MCHFLNRDFSEEYLLRILRKYPIWKIWFTRYRIKIIIFSVWLAPSSCLTVNHWPTLILWNSHWNPCRLSRLIPFENFDEIHKIFFISRIIISLYSNPWYSLHILIVHSFFSEKSVETNNLEIFTIIHSLNYSI